VLYGVPGTGKTHKAIDLANSVVQGAPENTNVKKVQFHPGYSYADFIIGIRPVTTVSGQVNYRTTKGVLYEWAEKAVKHQGQNFCLIIDEINRANLAEVLGEAMYCLEYRGEKEYIQLPQIIESEKEPEGERDRLMAENDSTCLATST
jgi:5-methylcytosine-specific restriction protein B